VRLYPLQPERIGNAGMRSQREDETNEAARDDPRWTYGLFNLTESAKYLGIPQRTMHNWGRGTQAGASPLITVRSAPGRGAVVPFIGFAEAFALNALRRAGVPLQRIRPAVENLKREIGLEAALASRNLATDGVEVLYKYAGDDPDHTVVRSKQKQFRRLVEEYLEPIHYGTDDLADRVWLPVYERAKVFVDPRKAFGQPLLASGRARVEDIADRFAAGETIKEIAFDFRVSPEEVEDVIRVETLAARSPRS
jgi:uncharacterized protein (DUF433 family)